MCNGVDDDCDPATADGQGDPDVLFTRLCDTGEPGRCSTGSWQCAAGSKSCARSAEPRIETCDNPGADDDCNGDVDDVPTLGDGCDSGDADLCRDDSIVCVRSAPGCADSTAGDSDRVELCDGVDNDCNPATPDGTADSRVGSPCDSPDDEDACLDDTQGCADGAIVCLNSSAGDASRLEICDGEDNDCDGRADEGPELIYFWDADRDGVGSRRVSWASVCLPEDSRNVSVGGDCDDRDESTYPGASEVCDGADNDCDALTTDGADDVRIGVEGDGLAYPGPTHCQASVTACSAGVVIEAPRMADGTEYGERETVSVASGILVRDSGRMGAGWHLMTADERHAYSLSYDIDESSDGGFHGWRFVIYDPRRAWAVVADRTVPATSYYTNGVTSDGEYLYPMGFGAGWSVDRIRISDGQVVSGASIYTDDDGDGRADCDSCDVTSGQTDPATGLTVTGRLNSAEIQFYAGLPWAPPAGAVGELAIPNVPEVSWHPARAPAAGFGVVGTDGHVRIWQDLGRLQRTTRDRPVRYR